MWEMLVAPEGITGSTGSTLLHQEGDDTQCKDTGRANGNHKASLQALKLTCCRSLSRSISFKPAQHIIKHLSCWYRFSPVNRLLE